MWLKSHGLSKYARVFVDNEIKGCDLSEVINDENALAGVFARSGSAAPFNIVFNIVFKTRAYPKPLLAKKGGEQNCSFNFRLLGSARKSYSKEPKDFATWKKI